MRKAKKGSIVFMVGEVSKRMRKKRRRNGSSSGGSIYTNAFDHNSRSDNYRKYLRDRCNGV